MRPSSIPPFLRICVDKIGLLLENLRINEAGVTEITRKLCVVASFSPAGPQGKLIALMIGGELIAEPARKRIEILCYRHSDLSTGAQHTGKLGQCLLKMREEENCKSAENIVKGNIWERQMLGIHGEHSDIRQISSLNLCRCFLNHASSQVNADYLTTRTDGLSSW